MSEPISLGKGQLIESYAQFVFKHFGGWWMRNDPMKPEAADLLPLEVEKRVSELSMEYLETHTVDGYPRVPPFRWGK